MTNFDFIYKTDPPWIYIGEGEAERKKWNTTHFYSKSGLMVCARHFRGNKMMSTPALMDEISAALQFFEDFGANWFALEECLQYLDEWIPADVYVLAIEHSAEVLIDERQDQIVALMKTIDAVGEWWSLPISDNERFNRDPVPFHVLFYVNGSNERERLVQAAKDANVSILT